MSALMKDFATIPANARSHSPRHALLDLAPLELDCMNTLWPAGEATVREIRDRLAERLPRAYTTIMTIMDRLAQKGVVTRRKAGRAYIYRPNLTAEAARAQALGQVVQNFFGGSKEALLAQLGASSPACSAPPKAASASASGGAVGGSSVGAAAGSTIALDAAESPGQ
jgi:BlaI family transcriptional regulator, penicillinase repressor